MQLQHQRRQQKPKPMPAGQLCQSTFQVIIDVLQQVGGRRHWQVVVVGRCSHKSAAATRRNFFLGHPYYFSTCTRLLEGKVKSSMLKLVAPRGAVKFLELAGR